VKPVEQAGNCESASDRKATTGWRVPKIGTGFLIIAVIALGVLAGGAAGKPGGQSAGRLVVSAAPTDVGDGLSLAVMQPDGSGLRWLTRNDGPTGGARARWTRDGKAIVFRTLETPTSRYANWRLTTGTGRPERLPGNDRYDTVSPSGTRVAVHKTKSVNIVGASGRRLRTLRVRLAPPGLGAEPLWSPDERYLAVFGARGGTVVARTDGRGIGKVASDAAPMAWSPNSRLLLLEGGALIRPNGQLVRRIRGMAYVSLFHAVAWSPGGERIAYVGKRGGIFVVPASGGTAVQVARATGGQRWAESVSLSWSSTGREIAFSDTCGVTLITVKALRTKRLAASGALSSVDWSPRGRQILLSGNTANEAIAVVGKRGRVTQKVTDFQDVAPEWSPDGSEVVFVRTSSSEDPAAVFVIGADGKGLRRIGSGQDPHWAPDGTRLAFVSGKKLVVADADGTNALAVATGKAGKCGGTRVGEPTWAPGGNEIAFLRVSFGLFEDFHPPECGLVNVALDVVGVDGTGHRRLDESGDGVDAWGAGAFSSPDWSPTGRTIALIEHVLESGRRFDRLVLIDAQTGTRTPIQGSVGDQVGWSPDGKRIATVGKQTIVISLDDRRSLKIAVGKSVRYVSPAWSPEGGSLAFVGVRDNRKVWPRAWHLYVADASLPDSHRVTKANGVETSVDWGMSPAPT
jgi:Tol biopolymer transport system component